jgi:hypothetical protein
MIAMAILQGKPGFRVVEWGQTCSAFSQRWRSGICSILVSLWFLLAFGIPTFAQLNENCTVSILNRTAQVKPDGTWIAINVPANFGQVRARATCVENGITRSGQSQLFTVPPNGSVTVPAIVLDALVNPVPASIRISAPATSLTAAGDTIPLTVIATYPNGSEEDVTLGNTSTSYTNSNTRVATVSADGLVTAISSGTVIISALNEGALGLIQIRVTLSGGDADGDGIPDDIETANGLNPNDPTDGFADPDGDGLTNKQELVDFGTRIDLADTDGDSISDGEEVKAGTDGFITNPLLRDTDGDGVDDNVEIASGSDPTNPNSRPGVTSLTVSPENFVLTVNSLIGEASRQLTVTGRRADGGAVDLTNDPGTNYASSDLNVCNFGAERGRVFAGSNGTCTITVTNNGQSGQATVTVQTFAPTAVSFIALPGVTNNVDVSGGYAYVATGAAGLQVVDVRDPQALAIVGAKDTPGNANDVVVVGNLAYVADGSAGLQIIDVTDPRNPVQRGSLDTPGDAQDVVVKNARAFVADGVSGLQIIDISNPQTPTLLGTVDTPGSASGVDVDPQRNLVVVADGATGIRVIDITDVAHPTIVGNIDTGTATDVAVRDGFAFVADGESSFTVVDLSDPRNPAVRASTHELRAVCSLMWLWLGALASAQIFSLLTAYRLSISAPQPTRFHALFSISAPSGMTMAQASPWTVRLSI